MQEKPLHKPRIGVLIQLSEHIKSDLCQLARMGFSTGQLACEDQSLYQPEYLEMLRQAIRETGFTFQAMYCGWSGYHTYSYPDMYHTLGLVPEDKRERRIQDVMRGIDFASQLGIPAALTHVGFVPDNPLDPVYLRIAAALREISAYAGNRGMRFLFETGDMLPVTLKELIRSLRDPWIGVNLDPANFLTNGRANPLDALRMLSPYVWAVHAKDGTYPVGDSPKGEERPIGQGQADFPALIRELHRMGYTGDIAIENEMDGPERENQLLAAKQYLTQLVNEIYGADHEQ